MLPATTVAVSTERIMATAAMVMATSTISAMNSVTPRWRRRIGRLLWAYRFMSARLPDPVAQRHRRLEHAVAVALPVRVRREVEPPVCHRSRHGRTHGRTARPRRIDGGRVAGRAAASRFFGKRAARHHGDPHRDDLWPVRRRGDVAIDD